ncbi:MAG TPA: AraC family transcriptional regulator [Puia sp.]|nr:AraC family transcriptional regulator [Puia sp.]
MEQFEKLYLYKRIVQAKLFIDHHYAEKIDLDNISDQACFSKFHFIRLFKSLYGRTPHNYLLKIRIERSRLLLSEGHCVFDVSLMTGFDSPTSFTAAFKKSVGEAPSRFKERQRTRQRNIRSNPFCVVPNCFAETHGWTKSQFLRGEI